MADPILSVRGLTTELRRDDVWRRVVSDVSFDIAPGETVALVGESGSGKSMTALSIMGLTPHGNSRISGSVAFGGINLAAAPRGELRRIRGNEIAMIFQEPMTSLNPVLTIGYQISEALRLHRGLSQAAAWQETIRLLERVQIPAAKTRAAEHPHRFSGGMRQRVMIAMALACRPKLLIADEPTTALDVTIQAQILNLIKQLQDEEGMSVLFITHDMAVVAEIADRTIVMYRGEAVETGATAGIFAAPRHNYTRTLLSAVPKLGSMEGSPLPRRFPVVDPVSGVASEPADHDTMTPGAAPVLEVDGLTTRFAVRGGLFKALRGQVHAVENVSFSLRPGETLALVGESGSGKSTTGRSVMRLMEPAGGSVKLDGENLLAMDQGTLRARRKKIQMVFQDPFASLDPRMSVGDAIAEPLIIADAMPRAAARERAMHLLRRVGLSADMAGRYPHEFSGGQRQRIAIARALSVEPQVIVADEAVSALDVSVKAEVINLLLELQAEKRLAYLFISHDMAVVERVSHRVAVMYLGEIVEIGPRESIFRDPRHPYTRRLLAAVPVADPARRHRKRTLGSDEIGSAFRPLGYKPPPRHFDEVAEGHFVQVAS